MKRFGLLFALLLPVVGFANHFVGGHLSVSKHPDKARTLVVTLLLVSDCDATDANIIYDNPWQNMTFHDPDSLDMDAQTSASDWTLVDSGQYTSASFPYCSGVQTTCDDPLSTNIGFRFALWEGEVERTPLNDFLIITYQECCYYNGLTAIQNPSQTDFMLQVTFDDHNGVVPSQPIPIPQLTLRACLGETMRIKAPGFSIPEYNFTEPISVTTGEATATSGYNFSQPLQGVDLDTLVLFPPNVGLATEYTLEPQSPGIGLMAFSQSQTFSGTFTAQYTYTEHAIFAQVCPGIQQSPLSVSPFINAGSDTTEFKQYGPDSLIFTGLGLLDSLYLISSPSDIYVTMPTASDSVFVINDSYYVFLNAPLPIIFEASLIDSGTCTYRKKHRYTRWFMDMTPWSRAEALPQSAIAAYPNPNSTGVLTIESQSDARLQRIRVLSVDGQLLRDERRLPSSVHELRLPREAGVYLVEIETNKGLLTKRVVRQ